MGEEAGRLMKALSVAIAPSAKSLLFGGQRKHTHVPNK